ncbi:MBL fold metallo-hydrolase RNA specificity domain-containing protein [Gramella sp. KN1008]|uniref:MBL fold metallo-hydrolase RNA specificity domain-containing protein n=1 Tax=Gramella sp. KN1008 TaxID=2529298 RepID=UPI00103A36FA|nr:MBL fold metallo-hydrolase [Gramella sp. KN1008]TBW28689.1 MBL fold metallo-hydrolase [Gramella sp. KN1008]
MAAKIKVQFLGAAGTVTGSKFYIEAHDMRLLVDCGLFQGLKELRQTNWEDLPIPVNQLDYVLLTHGHLDHTGYLPRLIQQGFKGGILGTAPTLSIAKIILMDTAKIQEEEAEEANREHYSKHDPALPLYTEMDAEKAIELFKSVNIEEWIEISEKVKFRLRPAGHILGACFLELDVDDKILLFSGDLGRNDDLLLPPPQKPQWADYLFLESTYGNKLHPAEDVEEILVRNIRAIIDDNSILLIASFAVERLQLLSYILWKLFKKNKIPHVPVYIDSPMGIDVTELFGRYPKSHAVAPEEFKAMKTHFELVSSYKRTWEIIDEQRPRIVIAGSGMLTGGRILTYLKQFIDIPTTRLVLSGYQAEGTRGRQLEEGVHEIRIRGKYYPVNAHIEKIESLSAHADQAELIDWCHNIKNVPEQVFLIHGERQVADAFRVKLESEFTWNIKVPSLNDSFEL